MYVFKIIFLLLVFFSSSVFADFYEKTALKWVGTSSVKVNPNFKSGSVIDKPIGTTEWIMEITYKNRKWESLKDCMIYTTPEKKKPGHLKIISTNVETPCKDVALSRSTLMENGIFNFGFELNEKNLILNIDTKILSYHFFNLPGKANYKPGTSSATNSAQPGLFITFNNLAGEASLKSGSICFDVDSECNTILKNTCHLCPGKVLESISSSCSTNYRRYCQNTVCGGLNLPACIRGQSASKYTGDYCIAGSPLAFCQKSYKVICEKGQLVCRDK